MKSRPRKWRELSSPQRAAIVVASTVQLALQSAALVDLYRRESAAINGDKRAWAVASFVNFAGPIAYFVFGRKR